MVAGARYSPELIAKVISMRAAGTTQCDVAKHFGLDPRTVRKFENLQTIPARAADPEQLKNEWFGVLATRIRLAAATDDNAATADLIRAGAALITACGGMDADHIRNEVAAAATGGRQADDGELTGKPTLKDIKAMKPMVIHVPVGKTAAGVNEDENEQ